MMWRWIAFLSVAIAWVNVGTCAEPRLYGGQSEARWIEALSHPSNTMRTNAARALAEIGGDEAVGPLLAALVDRDTDVRLHAAWSLGRIRKQPERCLPALTKMLRDADEHVRYSAQFSLGQIAAGLQGGAAGEQREELGALLASAATAMEETGAHEGLRQKVEAASEAFQKDTKPSAVIAASPPAPQTASPPAEAASPIEKLASDLRTDDDYELLKALARVKQVDPQLAAPLLKALAKEVESDDWSLLQWKLPAALAEVGPSIIPALVETLTDGDEAERELAVDVLAKFEKQAASATEPLVRLFDEEDATEELQNKILAAFAEMGPAAKSAAPWLARLTGDEEREETLRIGAVSAIEKIGPSAGAAAASLLTVLRRNGETTELRIAAGRALVAIRHDAAETTQVFVQTLRAAEDAELAVGLAEVLATLGPEAASGFPVLLQLIQAAGIEDGQRARLIRAVGEMGPRAEKATPTFVRLLTDPERDEAVHVSAAHALGKIGPGSVRAMADELPRTSPEVRLTLARALAAIGPAAEPAKDLLVRLLESQQESDDVRTLAAIALAKIGAPASAAVPSLVRVFKNQAADGQLRAMCLSAIGNIDPSQNGLIGGVRGDPDKHVQVVAHYMLAKVRGGNRDSLRRLIQMLTDADAADLAEKALIDLGEIAVPALATAANDSKRDLEMRLKCIAILGIVGNEAIEPLIAAMNEEELAEAAADALLGNGQEHLPALMRAAEDEVRFGPEARERFRELVRMLFDGLGAGGDDTAWGEAHPLVRSSDDAPGRRIRMGPDIAVMGKAGSARATGAGGSSASGGQPLASVVEEPTTIEAEGYKTVKVFYGTNRKPLEAEGKSSPLRFSFDSLLSAKMWAGVALAICLVCLLWQKSRSLIALVASSLGLAVLVAPHLPLEWLFPLASVAQPRYGGEHSTQVELGVCEVTIPRIHEEGQLEGPSVLHLELTVDPEKHIVLKSVRRMENDTFYTDLQGELGRKGKNVLVFVHGYNVSFVDAARRTAQMAEDLKFPGAAIFYSWPSQANWYHYRLDEKNVELSVTPLKSFLLEVAQRSKATTINLVAHSMGNRALTNALQEIDGAARGNETLFNQVILAAPDIDATIFKERIAPAIVKKAQHITLYASSKDLALLASRQFNSGDARAGDVGGGLVVVPGVETIDASAGDCSLLGHCYYGDSVSVLRDIASLLQNQPAQARPFLEAVPYNGMTYWLFHPPEVAAEEMPGQLR